LSAAPEERLSAEAAALTRAGRRPCSTCGTPVDPLRAERVAIFDDRFRYFCSAACRERFDPVGMRTPIPRERAQPDLPRATAEVQRASPEIQRASAVETESAAPHPSVHQIARVGREEPLSLPSRAERDSQESTSLTEAEASADAVAAAEPPMVVGSLLLGLSTVAGILTVALALAGSSPAAITARLVLVTVAVAALVVEAWIGHREETELRPLALVSGPLLAVAVAVFAYATSAEQTSVAITLAALIVAGAAASAVSVRRVALPLELERELIAHELDGPSRRIVGEEVAPARSLDLRPGEEIIVEAGEVVPVDATVTAGSAVVLPWRGASVRTERGEGDVVVGGARVLEGRLRAVVSWAGHDRAWIRLSNDPRRRADLYAALARSGRFFTERLAPFATAAAALTTFAGEMPLVELGMLVAAVQASLASPVVTSLPALSVARAVLDGLRRGIAFRTADALDRASKVSTLTFCARGTVLLGEPEVANIEAFGDYRPADVLALVAGAESGAQHAIASAVLRAARARGVRPDGVRSPTLQPGLGTTAVASNGQPLVVGSRALMLREHVSVAAAESRITDLEALGQSVLLVALGGRLAGLLALQDGLRPGARAAVQHLLDVGVEPVLLSGDARETCEALGRALDVDHIRPEIPPGERGDAIKRLADGGAIVAVVGHSPTDDVALGAADVSIALHAAGSTASEWSVQLASDDVRDAAFAIRLAHDARREARFALLLGLSPAALGSLMATLGLGPPALGPLGALLGGLLALLRFRTRR
jgi:cation transport ATPase